VAPAAWGSIGVGAHTLPAPTSAQAMLDAALGLLVFAFLAGCATAYVCATGVPRRLTAVAGMVGCGVLVIGLLWSETLFGLSWLRVAVFGTGAALRLIGCFGEDVAIRHALPRVIARIGDASYSFYLSHLFSIGVVGYVLSYLLPSVRRLATPDRHAVALCATILTALLAAGASYRWIERSLLRLSRYLIEPRTLPCTVPAA
jgi:peptidoglycan/LPS O-acetylase OafA/YrhL